jgi:dolichol-phosphate mannosyltransferase
MLRRGEADVVIASRYCPAGATENNVLLIFMSRILNWTYSMILGIRCKDVSNSFRVYDAAQLRELKLSCNNFDVIQEILLKLSRRKSDFTIVEVPFTFKKRMFGKTKRNLMLFIMTYIFTLVRLRFSR